MATQLEYKREIEYLKAHVREKDKQVQEKDRKIQELEIMLNGQQLQFSIIPQLEGEDVKRHGAEIEKLKKEIENLRDETNVLKREIENLTSKIQILEGEKEEFREQTGRLEKNLSQQIDDFQEYKKDHEKKESDDERRIKELEETIDNMMDFHMLYIAQIGYKFAKQAYYFVLGEGMYKKHDYEYFMTALEGIIEKIKDEDQRKQARENWKVFQEKVKWEPQMGKDLHNLRKKRIPAAHPPDLQKWKAQEFIDKLAEKGKLRGGISKPKVQNILRMWEISCNLVPDKIVKS